MNELTAWMMETVEDEIVGRVHHFWIHTQDFKPSCQLVSNACPGIR
jgi:hypothetical protein